MYSMSFEQVRGLIKALEALLIHYYRGAMDPVLEAEAYRVERSLEHYEVYLADLCEEESILLHTISALP